MVVIWTKEVCSRGTIKGIQDANGKILKSCIQCGENKDLHEFNKNTNLKSHQLFEVLEDECLDCMVNNKAFPLFHKMKRHHDNGYQNFKKLFIEDNKRSDYEIWEFKYEPQNYVLFIKDQQKEIFFNHLFSKMQGENSTRHTAYRYFSEEYGADFFAILKSIRICSFFSGRSRPLVRRNYPISEFLTFIPTIYAADLQEIEKDIEAAEIEEDSDKYQSMLEGKAVQYYGNKYERSPVNRKKALELHGFCCKVCDFNFEKAYGERGKEFIEVHHIKPLHTLGGKQEFFDPRTDLIPVCSNCHRIIHRRPDNVLSIDEMKKIVNKMNS
ncbi:HNH endonuclease [Cytobacillus sp. FSL R5-0596]|uniref:HNH endonuclease n=1 Tax=Cytobacillus sp. FSL R5-0596 TaxID=2954696 RepID=UPI0030F9CA4A